MKNKVTQATIRTTKGYETIAIDQLTESMEIVRIGNKHMKPYIYSRAFDLTDLSTKNAQRYGLEPKIYKYIGVSTESNFNSRTAKWVNLNINRENKLGEILIKLGLMLKELKGIENINDYINSNSEVIAYCDTIEQAKEYEKSLIGIVQLEQEQWGLDVVCLNSNDKPIKVKEKGYELRL